MTRPDPRIIDEPITGEIKPELPSWCAIAVAWAAGLILIIAIWSL